MYNTAFQAKPVFTFHKQQDDFSEEIIRSLGRPNLGTRHLSDTTLLMGIYSHVRDNGSTSPSSF